MTSKWPAQPSDRSDWSILTERFLRSNRLRDTDSQMSEKPGNTAHFWQSILYPWHQYYRLDVARGNETTESYPSLVKGNMSTDRCLFAKMRSGTCQRFACSSGTCQPILGGCQFMGTYRQTEIYLDFSFDIVSAVLWSSDTESMLLRLLPLCAYPRL